MNKLVVASLIIISRGMASEQSGLVITSSVPVPGVSITAVKGAEKRITITDEKGQYMFADVADGIWTFSTEMTGFTPMTRQLSVTPKAPPEKWDLKLLPIDQIKTAIPMGTHLPGCRSAAGH
jgi:hypothetical protein